MRFAKRAFGVTADKSLVSSTMFSLMLDEMKRAEVAKSLDDLAAQEVCNADVWQRC